MKKGYVVELIQPRRYDLPMWPEKRYEFVKTKKEIREAIKRYSRSDTNEVGVYLVSMEKLNKW
jgi:hypothetical protein